VHLLPPPYTANAQHQHQREQSDVGGLQWPSGALNLDLNQKPGAFCLLSFVAQSKPKKKAKAEEGRRPCSYLPAPHASRLSSPSPRAPVPDAANTAMPGLRLRHAAPPALRPRGSSPRPTSQYVTDVLGLGRMRARQGRPAPRQPGPSHARRTAEAEGVQCCWLWLYC
jgi:hypothetical protein